MADDQKMSGIIVLEVKWEKKLNISVKSLFDVLSDMHYGSPHRYQFYSFANAKALADIVEFACGHYQRNKYIYVGAHGQNDYIMGAVDKITRAKFRNSLKETGGKIKGIYLGTCKFGSEKNAKFLFEDEKGLPANVMWVAGYTTEVDWVESSVLDMLFWNTLLSFDRKFPSKPAEAIVKTCDYVKDAAPGLIKKWGLRVYKRKKGPKGDGGNLRPLIP